MNPIRGKLRVQYLVFEPTLGWLIRIHLLKENDNNTNKSTHPRYFKSVTAYGNFWWNSNHF